jgi:hypothetical protein
MAYHCRSSLDGRCRRLNSRSDWLMDKGPTPKPLSDGKVEWEWDDELVT